MLVFVFMIFFYFPSFLFVFLAVPFLFLPLLVPSLFECTYILWICSWYYLVARDTGWYPQLVRTAPLRTGTAVHELICSFCFLQSISLFVACFAAMGYFRETS